MKRSFTSLLMLSVILSACFNSSDSNPTSQSAPKAYVFPLRIGNAYYEMDKYPIYVQGQWAAGGFVMLLGEDSVLHLYNTHQTNPKYVGRSKYDQIRLDAKLKEFTSLGVAVFAIDSNASAVLDTVKITSGTVSVKLLDSVTRRIDIGYQTVHRDANSYSGSYYVSKVDSFIGAAIYQIKQPDLSP